MIRKLNEYHTWQYNDLPPIFNQISVVNLCCLMLWSDWIVLTKWLSWLMMFITMMMIYLMLTRNYIIICIQFLMSYEATFYFRLRTSDIYIQSNNIIHFHYIAKLNIYVHCDCTCPISNYALKKQFCNNVYCKIWPSQKFKAHFTLSI